MSSSPRAEPSDPEQARALSRELREFLGEDEGRWQRVESLATVVASRAPRSPGIDLTLFKSLGMGIADLALHRERHGPSAAPW